MNTQRIWNALTEVENHLEEARNSLHEIHPPDVAHSPDDHRADSIASKISSIERDLGRAIAEARAACFDLVDDVTVTIDEDPDFDPSEDIEP